MMSFLQRAFYSNSVQNFLYENERHKFSEYTRGLTMSELLNGLRYTVVEKLHRAVSLRSFRSENVAIFVKSILDVDKWNARSLYDSINIDYPIYLTRDLDKAKLWIKSQANGTERYGIVASSGAKRLRSSGIWVQSKADTITWFLNDSDLQVQNG